jgi:hypothetical protein
MSKLTALQEAMRIVEKYAPNLFNIYSLESRNFLYDMKNLLEDEQDQIEQSYIAGCNQIINKPNSEPTTWACEYYNETYK